MPQTAAAITRSEFESWVQAVVQASKVPSLRALTKISGISKSTLSYQLNSDSIPAETVLKVSRGLALQPLYELSAFAGFMDLLADLQVPTAHEVLALISPRDLLLEGARRLGTTFTDWQIDDFFPTSDYWKRWFNVAAPKITGAALSNVIGISESQIYKNHRDANWSIEHLALMSRNFRLNFQLSLVASGNVNLCEAGLHPDIREKALAAATDEELQTHIASLAGSFTELRQKTIESDPKHVFMAHLG